jgi:hypothetical protein
MEEECELYKKINDNYEIVDKDKIVNLISSTCEKAMQSARYKDVIIKEITEKIIRLILEIPKELLNSTGNEMWNEYDCSTIERKSNKSIYITLDPNHAQIMFIVEDGFLRIMEYLKNKTIYLKLTNKLFGELDDPRTHPFKLSVINDKNIVNNSLYNDIKKIIEYGKKDVDNKEYNIIEVLKFMFTEYSTSAKPFIAILGKARFNIKSKKVIKNAYDDTYEIFSNLLFRNCNLGFMTGGYNGYPRNYGITRSGFELAKHFEKPSVVVMCNAGIHNSHENTDAKGLYGIHWGDDTPALSLLADASIFIAPFGAWTFIELASFALREKPAIIFYNNNMFKDDKETSDYVQNDYENIMDIYKLLDKSNADNFGIKENFFWGTWYCHFDKEKKYGIPIVTNHAAAAEYILRKIGTNCDYTTKARILSYALYGKDLGFGEEIEVKLNRKIDNKLNVNEGIYYDAKIDKDDIIMRKKRENFCVS